MRPTPLLSPVTFIEAVAGADTEAKDPRLSVEDIVVMPEKPTADDGNEEEEDADTDEDEDIDWPTGRKAPKAVAPNGRFLIFRAAEFGILISSADWNFPFLQSW